jgi:hypothetical protein
VRDTKPDDYAVLIGRLHRSGGFKETLEWQAADAIERLVRERDEALGRVEWWRDAHVEDVAREIKRAVVAENQVRQLQEDAARYRWLRDDRRGRALSVSALEWSGDPDKADASIDAAMQSEKL